MHFSIFGKEVVIIIPRRVPPVENGRGVMWEDAMMTNQSTFSMPVSPKSVFSTMERYILSAYRAIFRPHLEYQGSRTIVVERLPSDAEVVGVTAKKEGEEECTRSPYTEGIIHPAKLSDMEFTEEDTYHMGFEREQEASSDSGNFQGKPEEPQ